MKCSQSLNFLANLRLPLKMFLLLTKYPIIVMKIETRQLFLKWEVRILPQPHLQGLLVVCCFPPFSIHCTHTHTYILYTHVFKQFTQLHNLLYFITFISVLTDLSILFNSYTTAHCMDPSYFIQSFPIGLSFVWVASKFSLLKASLK